MKKLLITSCLFVQALTATESPITTIFCHGLGGDKNQVLFYAENNSYSELDKIYSLTHPLLWSILKNPVHSFNFPHSQNGKLVNNLVSLAQDIEINTIKKQLDTITGPKILMGLSMGASSIITCMSRYPNPDVKALVLESPFDSIETVVANETKAFSWIPGIKSIGHSLVGSSIMYPSYKPHGIKPINCLKTINKNMPILFIHSKKDALIPVQSSRTLYCALKQIGHQHVYLLELNDGNHANYFYGTDVAKYQSTVHAFYKKYNLPCDEELAVKGQAFLSQCQPNVKDVKNRK